MIHCPTCGAGLRFDIDKQKMACDYCNNVFPVNEITDNTRDDAKKESTFYDTYIYVCPDCGAEIATNDKNDAIGFCPYCLGASMLYDKVRREWKPDFVIPFEYNKEQCKDAYIREVKKHPFVSRKYRDPDLIESFRGIYMPYWYYEGSLNGNYHIKETKTEGAKVTEYTQEYLVDNYSLSGINHDASVKFDDHISERLDPYHTADKKPFHPGYLSGFYAETGDIDKDEYRDYVAEKFKEHTLNNCKGTVLDFNIDAEIKTMSNVLHPVWFMSYRHKNKVTYAAVNGQTGKVAADLPTSPLRVLLATVFSSLLIFGIVYLIMSILPSLTAANTAVVCSMIAGAAAFFLHKAHLETVADALRMQNIPFPKKKTGVLTAVFWSVAVIGVILIITDGSFAHGRMGFGIILASPAGLYCIIQILKQIGLSSKINHGLNINKPSQLENAIAVNAKVFNILFGALKLLTYITCLAVVFCGINDFFSKSIYYIMCGVLAVEIIVQALLYIYFQIKVAHRRPSQMDKKGALYDEK